MVERDFHSATNRGLRQLAGSQWDADLSVSTRTSSVTRNGICTEVTVASLFVWTVFFISVSIKTCHLCFAEFSDQPKVWAAGLLGCVLRCCWGDYLVGQVRSCQYNYKLPPRLCYHRCVITTHPAPVIISHPVWLPGRACPIVDEIWLLIKCNRRHFN